MVDLLRPTASIDKKPGLELEDRIITPETVVSSFLDPSVSVDSQPEKYKIALDLLHSLQKNFTSRASRVSNQRLVDYQAPQSQLLLERMGTIASLPSQTLFDLGVVQERIAMQAQKATTAYHSFRRNKAMPPKEELDMNEIAFKLNKPEGDLRIEVTYKARFSSPLEFLDWARQYVEEGSDQDRRITEELPEDSSHLSRYLFHADVREVWEVGSKEIAEKEKLLVKYHSHVEGLPGHQGNLDKPEINLTLGLGKEPSATGINRLLVLAFSPWLNFEDYVAKQQERNKNLPLNPTSL